MTVGKYQPLFDYLRHNEREEVTLPFTRLEKLLRSSLPDSARAGRAWWSNRARGGLQAQAWLAAGYRVVSVDLNSEHVTFHKLTRKTKLNRAAREVVWNGAMIEALRRHMKLNQSQFAAEIGVRQQTVSEWESGVYQPKRSIGKLLTFIADRENFRG